ncbi:exoribonuclease R [Vibrio maerlii]|uniref:exoribonuclease R n=1 Tax=Vibrio maerlii TaxID=2231648 RepID=UPI000E3BCCF3|nr:exoribonuclease R [Vibrio maerlii]
MSLDYTYESLKSFSRDELEQFSLRMIHRLIPEETMTELFTFEQEETDSDERLQSAQFDAMLRMSAIALSEIPNAFSESESAQQNIERMSRLLLWHFYAISFQLEKAIPLEVHCNHAETLVKKGQIDVFQWVKSLTELLHTYAEISEKYNK